MPRERLRKALPAQIDGLFCRAELTEERRQFVLTHHWETQNLLENDRWTVTKDPAHPSRTRKSYWIPYVQRSLSSRKPSGTEGGYQEG